MVKSDLVTWRVVTIPFLFLQATIGLELQSFALESVLSESNRSVQVTRLRVRPIFEFIRFWSGVSKIFSDLVQAGPRFHLSCGTDRFWSMDPCLIY